MQAKTIKDKRLVNQFFKFLIPSISSMWFFSIYTMVDGMFVGRGVGPTALAAVNLSMPYISTIFAISLLVSVGSSTLITYYLGRNEKQISNEIFTKNIIIITLLGLFLSFISLFLLDEIALFLGATEETFIYVKEYLGIIIPSSIFFMLAYSLEVLVKADGFPIYSIIFVTLSAFTNIVLDYIFVICFDFGVRGAAIATAASQFISFLGFLLHFVFGRSNLKFVKPNIKLKYIKRISIGFPEFLTELSTGFITYSFNYIILRNIGAYGIAAFSVIMYINNLVISTMIAVNQAMQPLVSYYNGKKNLKKTQSLLIFSLTTAVIWGLIFFVSSQLFTDQLVSLFILPSNTEAYQIAVSGLRIFSFSFLLVGVNVILSGYFTALRFTRKATIVSMSRGYIFIALSLIILPTYFGDIGIWGSALISEILTLGIALSLYLSYAKAKGK